MEGLTVEINIVNTQLLEGLIKFFLDIGGTVIVVPEF